MGSTFVTVTRRAGRTIIGVLSARSDAAGVAGLLGGLGAFAASIALGTALVGVAGLAGPVAAATGIVAGSGGAARCGRRPRGFELRDLQTNCGGGLSDSICPCPGHSPQAIIGLHH
jgi:hypothetical protein